MGKQKVIQQPCLSFSSEQWKWVCFTILAAQLQATSKKNILAFQAMSQHTKHQKAHGACQNPTNRHLACFLRGELAQKDALREQACMSLAPSRCNLSVVKSNAPEIFHKWPLLAPCWSAIFTADLQLCTLPPSSWFKPWTENLPSVKLYFPRKLCKWLLGPSVHTEISYWLDGYRVTGTSW